MGFNKVCQRLLEYGVLAPSVYNSQPWRFMVDGNEGIIEVQAYFTNVRPYEIDPAQRDLYMALGACVENINIAAAALGYSTHLTLFPNSGTMARLQLNALPEAAPESLFSCLLTRQTHAGVYAEDSVADIHLDRLKNTLSASPYEKDYVVKGAESSKKIADLLHDLSHDATNDPMLMQEATRWTKPSDKAQEGIPMKALGLPISARLRFSILRYWSYRNELEELGRQALLRQGHGVEAPAYLLMTSSKPGRESYFNAGRWWARLALTLSELELGAQALSLPISMPASYDKLREIFAVPEKEEPVLLVRFGQPFTKQWPRTNRRAFHGDVYYAE